MVSGMKSITVFITIFTILFIGCSKEVSKTSHVEPAAMPSAAILDLIKNHYHWDPGQEVERVGVLQQAKQPGGKAEYFIRCDDSRNPSLISTEIDQLKRGTTLWVKGNIEYIQYDKPPGTPEITQFGYPQVACYLHLKDFKIIKEPNQVPQLSR
jgi:hypothetical protein